MLTQLQLYKRKAINRASVTVSLVHFSHATEYGKPSYINFENIISLFNDQKKILLKNILSDSGEKKKIDIVPYRINLISCPWWNSFGQPGFK